jgi:hypothetical protein
LQDEVADAREIQRVKEVMARQAQKKESDVKKKLEDTELKAKDAVADLHAVIDGKFPTFPFADSVCFARSQH